MKRLELGRSTLTLVGLGALALWFGAGCSADAVDDWEPQAAMEPVQTLESALVDGAGQDPFKPFFEITDRDGLSAASVDAPGICFSANGFVVLQRDASPGVYKSVTWFAGGVPLPGVANPRASKWAPWGGTRKFKSPPVCANLDPVDKPLPRTFKIVVGGLDNSSKLYTSSAQANTGGSAENGPDIPKTFEPWSEVAPNRTFAAAPAIGVSSTKVALVGRGTDGLMYGYTRAMPYDSNSWGSELVGPTLPDGYTPILNPAMAYVMANYNRFVVVVLGSKSGSPNKYFWTSFTGTSWGTSWNPINAWSAPSTRPALEFSTDVNALTLYGGQGSTQGAYPMQLTGLAGQGVYRSIRGQELPGVTGAPAAHGFDGTVSGEGIHRVVFRKQVTNKLYLSEIGLIQVYP